MDIQQSMETINTLANGVNPCTGESFSSDSPYNNPEIIRALFACIEYINKSPKPKLSPIERQQDNIKKGLPKNCGMLWTDGSKEQLEQAFNNGASFESLASTLERTIGSIKAQLQKQGLISEEELRRY